MPKTNSHSIVRDKTAKVKIVSDAPPKRRPRVKTDLRNKRKFKSRWTLKSDRK